MKYVSKKIFFITVLLFLVFSVYAADTLPDYWLNYLSDRISAVKQDMKKTKGHGETFIFISDIHVPNNSMKSPDVIKYVMEQTGISQVIMGGDYMTAHAAAADGLAVMESYISKYTFTDPIILRGNHDTNYQGKEKITDGQFISVVHKYSSKSYTNGSKMYFSYDNPKSKIRHIFLDTGDEHTIFVDKEQLNYMKKQIKNAPKGWNVIVFEHIFTRGGEASKGIRSPGLHEDGKRVKAVLDTLYSKTNNIIGVFCGHNHTDFHMYSEAGYPVIATTCDAGQGQASYWDPRQPLRPRGTINEVVFDVISIDTADRMIYMKRIGAGVDRQFHY